MAGFGWESKPRQKFQFSARSSEMQKRVLNPKSCQACSRKLLDGSFSFDDDCSLICGHCGFIVFSTRERKQHNHLQSKDLKQLSQRKPM